MKTINIAVTVDGSLQPLLLSVPSTLTVTELKDRVQQAHPMLSSYVVFDGESDEELHGSNVLTAENVSDRLHIGRRQQVKVAVNYQSKALSLRLPPSARVRRVKREAVEYFGISSADAAALVLVISGTADPLDPLTRLGSIDDKDREVCLDLVPDSRIQG